MSEPCHSFTEQCRSCGGTDLSCVYTVPPVPVAGIYYPAQAVPTNLLAPMSLAVCHGCGLVQLRETISPDIYRDYSFVGDSALSYLEHLEQVADLLVGKWGLRGKRVFEVGASNGVLLELLARRGANEVAGIEPSEKLCANALSRGVPVQQGYFNRGYLADKKPGKFDCVLIRHVLEHIDDLNDMVSSVGALLSEDGLLVVEIPDLDAIVSGKLFSNVFHEHLNYFSADSMQILLNRHDICVVEKRRVDIHGGALLLFCRLAKGLPSTPVQVDPQLETFAARARAYHVALRETVLDRRRKGLTVHGFGASHRTFVLLGNAGLGADTIPVLYDSNPFLHHQRLNGLHCLVKPKELIMESAPDVLLVLATSYEQEITSYIKNCGYGGEIVSVRYEALCGNP